MANKVKFPHFDIETPTLEQLMDEKKTKYNRYAYEWHMENTVKTHFNLTQEVTEIVFDFTMKQIKRTAILAATSTAVAVVALLVSVIKKR